MITIKERLRLFLRSFFVQTAWNYRGMQNLGFLYGVAPVLDRIWPDSKDRQAAYERHIQYFNTHPYLAPVIMGVALKMEKELKESEDPNPKLITLVKNRMAGPVAAVGDVLFWESLRPILAAFGAFIVFFFPGDILLAGIFIGAFLGVFTFLSFFYRALGLQWGLKHGIGVVEYLKSMGLQATARRIKNVGLVFAGIFAGVYITDPRIFNKNLVADDLHFPVNWPAVGITAAFLGFAFFLVRKKVPSTRAFWIITALAFAIGVFLKAGA